MARHFDELYKNDIQPKDNNKYQVGLNSDRFESVKHLKPVFAFDYMCEDKSSFSFTSYLLGASDFKKMMKGLKRISNNTYETLNREALFHFHDVRWKDVDVKESDFNKCIFGKGDRKGNMTPYQVKVFEEARLIGFLYRGVFYMVMFDRGHNAYKRK